MSRRGSSGQRATPAPSPSQRGGRGGRGGGGRGAPPQQQQRPSSSASAAPAAASASSSSVSRDFERRVSLEERSTPAPSTAPAPAPAPAPAQQLPPPSSTKAIRFPARPGFGTLGSKCVVRANHFLVDIADKDLCHYDVSVSPEVASRGTNRAIIQQLVATYKESHLGRRKPVYDGRKSLYTAGPLPFDSKEFVIKLVDKDTAGSTSSTTGREREFKVAIKFAARADLHHLKQFLRARQSDAPQETIQVLDVVLRESPSFNYTPVQRSFFSPELGRRSPLGDGLECWRGFYQSIRPTQMGLSLNIDISSTSFYEPIPVVDFVSQYLNLRDPTRPLSDTDRVKIKKALRGVKVYASHRKESSRQYRISGITAQPTSQLTFPIDDQGRTISVIEYFKEKYRVVLRKIFLPCLQVGSDARPTYLPMEVCHIVEGQRYSRKLNERQVTAILRAACQRPADRERNIHEMVVRNNYNRDQYAQEFGIQVQDRLASVDARVLPPPELKYHASGREANCYPRVGQWNMINKKMVNGGSVEYWTCINFSRLPPDAVHSFCHELVGMCRNIGMTFSPNPFVPIRTDRPNRIEMALMDVHKQATANLQSGDKKKHLQLLIIILPEMSGSYGKIKRICETELGIVSQCCQPRQASRVNKQYLENVALKINVKVGGRNTVLADAVASRIPYVTDVPTIIFGADVTHPQPGEDSSPSIAAVVASMDWPEVTKYRGLVSAQPHRQELIRDLFQVVQDPPAIPSDLSRDEWLAALPRALVAGFVKTDKDFQDKAQCSGTTVTFVIIDGWVVTVASVGDSLCVLESAEGAVYSLSADHRLEANEEERDRITASGGEVGRLNIVGGAEIGPLRCWPGGLCLSRSIGDMDVGEFIVPIPHVKQVKLSTAGGRLIISSDGVWDAVTPEMAVNCCRGLPADVAAAQIVKEALQHKGLRDDTTCIVVDILPPEKITPPVPAPKKQGKGVFKSMFRKKCSESSSSSDREFCDPDMVEEIFEEGSAVLAKRLEIEYPLSNMFKLFICAVCQAEMKSGEGISVHAGSSRPGRLRPWDGPFLCLSCQAKKEAMEGKRPQGFLSTMVPPFA